MDTSSTQQGDLSKLPLYQSHKKVRAAKIIAIDKDTAGQVRLVLEPEGFPPYPVTEDFVTRHKPQAGGYLVVYEDGYTSWSPAEPFETGYTRLP